MSDRVQALNDRFADNLVALRISRRMSRTTLEARSGIPEHVITKVENLRRGAGRRRPVSIGEAVVLAEALGVAPGELLRPTAGETGAVADPQEQRAERAVRAAVAAYREAMADA